MAWAEKLTDTKKIESVRFTFARIREEIITMSGSETLADMVTGPCETKPDHKYLDSEGKNFIESWEEWKFGGRVLTVFRKGGAWGVSYHNENRYSININHHFDNSGSIQGDLPPQIITEIVSRSVYDGDKKAREDGNLISLRGLLENMESAKIADNDFVRCSFKIDSTGRLLFESIFLLRNLNN